jgi:hypothetical protein
MTLVNKQRFGTLGWTLVLKLVGFFGIPEYAVEEIAFFVLLYILGPRRIFVSLRIETKRDLLCVRQDKQPVFYTSKDV